MRKSAGGTRGQLAVGGEGQTAYRGQGLATALTMSRRAVQAPRRARKFAAHGALWLGLAILALPWLVLASERTNPTADQPGDSTEIAAIVARVTANEKQVRVKLQEYSPRVETYLQFYQPDSQLGETVTNDDYFLGRLNFSNGIDSLGQETSFVPEKATGRWHDFRKAKERLALNQFALQPLVVDENNFDERHYVFEPVRWVYLGETRCLIIDVHPREPNSAGAFRGRIWVEGRNYAIVRMNGTRVNPPHGTTYVHFDCWRENLQPGEWLPVYVYSQESGAGNLSYKAQTRIWGYDLNPRQHEQAMMEVLSAVAAPAPEGNRRGADVSPAESERQLVVEAEQNVLDRLEKARLLAPPGTVDKVLETVVNNLIVTNHLDSLPPIHCRVMLTTPLESFRLADTIVLSRGMIDVLPDESSLAMILAHELAHVALGHKLDTKYAFNDRMQISDEELLAALDVARSPEDEAAADAKGIEFLKNSPYQDKLIQAGLFLRAVGSASPTVPHLLGAHLGEGLTEGNRKLIRMETLMSGSPPLAPKDLTQCAALPLGSRLQMNPWDGAVVFSTRQAVPLSNPTEKMPFRVTPLIPYLRSYVPAPKTVASVEK